MAHDYRSLVDETNAKNLNIGNSLDSVGSLADFLKQKQQFQQSQDFALKKQQQEHELKQAGAQENLQNLLGAFKSGQIPEGAGVSMGADSAAITRPASTGMIDLRKEAMERKGQEAYSKGLQKTTGFNAALTDIENLTNRSGKGGILTNPNETLQSAGAFKSMIPTSVIGAAESVGLSAPGGAEERKALERLQLEYQKSMTGARTSEDMSRRERQAMGWVTSGDPALVSKGVRALAHNVAKATKTTQAGYTPEVRDRVHQEMGDPMELLGKVYQDPALPAIQNNNVAGTPPPGNTLRNMLQPSQNVNAGQESPEQELARLKAKHGRQ